MPVIGERQFILTNIVGKASADIICCSDRMDYEFMCESLRKRNISYVRLSKEDAIKLMLSGNCLSYGCYLTSADETINQRARDKAKALYLGLSSEFGIAREAEPLGLDVSMLTIAA